MRSMFSSIIYAVVGTLRTSFPGWKAELVVARRTSANTRFEPGGLHRLGRQVKDGLGQASGPADMAPGPQADACGAGATSQSLNVI